MFNRTIAKRRVAIIGATTAIALAGGGAAFAYFTSTGTGTGTGSVATTTDYTVDVIGPTDGPISPGSTGETFTYTVMNNDSGTQAISGATISVAPSATAVGKGCTAALADYVVSGPGITGSANPATQTYTAPISIAGGATSSSAQLAFTVSMNDTGTNQSACEGDTPTVTVTVT